LAGVGIAIVAAGYQLYELSTLGRPGKEPGLVTRNIGRIVPARGDHPETDDVETDRSDTGSRDRE
jgi:hypothetical protein